MEIIDLALKQAFKRECGALNLVLHSVKPCAFITFKSNINISSIEYKAINYNENIVYFMFTQSKGYVNFMIFNLTLIERKLSQVHKHQSSYQFKTSKELISKLIKIHKNKDKLRDRLGIKKHADLNLIQGIIFGFPLRNIKFFDMEIKTNTLLPGRKFYSTKLSPSLIFVGYPTTKKESKKLIKKWETAIKKF